GGIPCLPSSPTRRSFDLVPSLKTAFSSSGVLNRSDATHFLKKTGLGINEIYGSTETGGIALRNVSENTDAWKPADVVSWRLSGKDRKSTRLNSSHVKISY